ncbi:MAG: prepilin-type N-terminal cleavage/methylation domain-containing protein [Pseudomonadaceae bacterium]|nr:MAG: prepilin-type N-terminal cleavage/methylation domain-containing protein [Pseudomonadaceae bacterium]
MVRSAHSGRRTGYHFCGVQSDPEPHPVTVDSQTHQSAERGFGLVELMIALTLGLVLVLGVVQVFVASNRTFNVQQHASALQEDARFVLSRLSSELRMVNMYGCLNLSRLPQSIQDDLPGAFDNPIGYAGGVLTVITADPNNQVFVSNTTASVSHYGAQWLIATNCRDQLRIASSGDVNVQAGDILIPLRQLEYRVQDNALQVRTNGVGNFETLITGVADLDVSFGLASTPGERVVDGNYVSSVASSDFNRIRSVRLVLQLSDSPANTSNAQVKTQEYSLVAALRNRMN